MTLFDLDSVIQENCESLFTRDPWILRAVSGYEIEFDSYPIQQHISNEILFSEDQKFVEGAIVPSVDEPGQLISTIFKVPKANGKFQPDINLKYLNYFVTYEQFKQETFAVVLDLVQEKDYFTSINLKDAYFSIFIK